MEGALKEYCKDFHQRTLALIFKILEATVYRHPPTPPLIYSLLFMIFNERHPSMHSDLRKVMQSVSLSPASLQVSQFQLQGFQATGAQRAAEQL